MSQNKVEPESELYLYELFKRLKEADFPLGISDYYVLIEALNTEIYPLEPTSLKQLIQTIWVKSKSQRQQFNAIFNELIDSASKISGIGETQPKIKPLQNSQKKVNGITDQSSSSSGGGDTGKSTKKYFFFPASHSAENSTTFDDKTEVVTAIKTCQQDWRSFQPIGEKKEYLPVTEQQMIQGWYRLKPLVCQGTRLELNIPATLEKIKRQGKFVPPVLKPRPLKHPPLLLLIDHKGSMEPFHVLSRQLVATAQQTGCLDPGSCYYFDNYPLETFYCDPQFNTEESLERVFSRLNAQNTVVLIFSDGGAAKGEYIPRRIQETQGFLKQLKAQVKAIAWLNPLPEIYWHETTAEEIDKAVKMVPADFAGFQKALEVLQ